MDKLKLYKRNRVVKITSATIFLVVFIITDNIFAIDCKDTLRPNAYKNSLGQSADVKDNFRQDLLKDLLRDWRNYEKNKDAIQRLVLEILGIGKPSDFKPKRPVRVITTTAGLGLRMAGDKPKVLQDVCGEPILYHVLKQTAFLDNRPVVVVRSEKWRDALGKEGKGGNCTVIKEALDKGGFDVEYVFQDYLKGDGYAVLSAKDKFRDFDGDILVVWGDMAVLNQDTVRWLVMIHQALQDVPLSIATTAKKSPHAPILEDGLSKKVIGSKKGAEIVFGRDDVGLFIGRAKDIFRALESFPKDKDGNYINPLDASIGRKGEMNFVQIAAIFAKEGKEVVAPPLADTREAQGVNTPEELRLAEIYRRQMDEERRLSQRVTQSDAIPQAESLSLHEAGAIAILINNAA